MRPSYNLSTAAQRLGISRLRVRRQLESGILMGWHDAAGGWRVDMAHVKRIVLERTITA